MKDIRLRHVRHLARDHGSRSRSSRPNAQLKVGGLAHGTHTLNRKWIWTGEEMKALCLACMLKLSQRTLERCSGSQDPVTEFTEPNVTYRAAGLAHAGPPVHSPSDQAVSPALPGEKLTCCSSVRSENGRPFLVEASACRTRAHPPRLAHGHRSNQNQPYNLLVTKSGPFPTTLTTTIRLP
ncbi:hypothetical protein AAFF_G00183850 [Aldrovandia affinis]|uniref:Uncharacterized protein n=1 Tax=Aldrovandia affinis TaxID=143900 RepID=A0AAD7RKP8_9TELE|nr:hypothetical protein AAFF_G00183850 [Aldrovandia affinis]